jgi:hypothetical protein
MRFNDIVSMAFNGAIAKLWRDAIAYGICAFCAIAAIIMAAWASMLALEPHVGVIYARLIMAGIFALVAIASVIAARSAHPARPIVAIDAQAHLEAAHVEAAPRSAQFAQLAMIVEAVLLGYSLSKRPRQ